jgi:protein MpaA
VYALYHLVDCGGPPEAPDQQGKLHLNRFSVYLGSLGKYAGVDLDKSIVTIELPCAGITPSESQISEMWTDLVAWLIQESTKDR